MMKSSTANSSSTFAKICLCIHIRLYLDCHDRIRKISLVDAYGEHEIIGIENGIGPTTLGYEHIRGAAAKMSQVVDKEDGSI